MGTAEEPQGVLAGCRLREESVDAVVGGIRAELLRLLPENPTTGAARRTEVVRVGVGAGVGEVKGCWMSPAELTEAEPVELLRLLPKNSAAFAPPREAATTVTTGLEVGGAVGEGVGLAVGAVGEPVGTLQWEGLLELPEN